MITLFLACASAALDPGVAFQLSGPVDGGVALDGDTSVGEIAWVWLQDGDVCARGDAVGFEPDVWRYAMIVEGPPDVDGGTCVPGPPELAGVGLVALGTPILLDGDADVASSIDPRGLLDWLAGISPLEGSLGATGGRVAAVASGHLLAVTADAEAWPDAFCRFDGLVPGLTLYADGGTGCAGWQPLAPPGTRTEFQGVALVPP